MIEKLNLLLNNFLVCSNRLRTRLQTDISTKACLQESCQLVITGDYFMKTIGV